MAREARCCTRRRAGLFARGCSRWLGVDVARAISLDQLAYFSDRESPKIGRMIGGWLVRCRRSGAAGQRRRAVGCSACGGRAREGTSVPTASASERLDIAHGQQRPAHRNRSAGPVEPGCAHPPIAYFLTIRNLWHLAVRRSARSHDRRGPLGPNAAPMRISACDGPAADAALRRGRSHRAVRDPGDPRGPDWFRAGGTCAPSTRIIVVGAHDLLQNAS